MEQSGKANPNAYVFILREGKQISDDPMDYSVLMVHTNCYETLNSPAKELSSKKKKSVPLFLHLRDVIRSVPAPAQPAAAS